MTAHSTGSSRRRGQLCVYAGFGPQLHSLATAIMLIGQRLTRPSGRSRGPTLQLSIPCEGAPAGEGSGGAGAQRLVWLGDAVWLEGPDATLADLLALPNLATAGGGAYARARPRLSRRAAP